MPAKITVNRNGSLRIEGDFEIVDPEGKPYGLAGRTVVCLCMALSFYLFNLSAAQSENLYQNLRPVERHRIPSSSPVGRFQLQDSIDLDRSVPQNKKSFRFRGRPQSECDWFMITEFGLLGRIAEGGSKFRSFDKFPVNVGYSSWELGLMRNFAAQQAVGFGLFAGIEWRDIGTGLGWGVKPRYRYWFNRNLALDLSPGLLLAATEENFKPPGFTGSASLAVKELLILTSSVEIDRFEGTYYDYSDPSGPSSILVKENRVSWYLGAKAGAGLGAITGSVGVLAVAVGVIIALSTLTIY